MKQYPVHFTTIQNGETLAWRACGSGDKTVVLLHGNMSSSVHWQTTMEALEPEFSVFAPDLRGFGDSSYLNHFDSLLELAEDVMALLESQNIGKFTVVGWSTGGGVALELAAMLPDKAEKAILLDSVGLKGYPLYKKDSQGRPILTEPILTKEEVAADPIQVLPVLTAYATGNREMMRALWNAAIYNLNQPPAEDYELYLDAIMKQRNLVDVDYALMTFNMTHEPTAWASGNGRMDQVRCPVVVMQGELDLVGPMAWAEETAAFFGDKARLITFANAGHSVITDDFPAFYAALRMEL